MARGTIPAEVLFIGEAPGVSEDILGRPFVGPACHLLDRIISTAIAHNGRSVTYAITNLVACFPRTAKEAKVNEPPPEAIKACRLRLVEFFRCCRPQLIVTLGKLAKQNLPASIASPTSSGAACLALVHPAAILQADISQRGLLVQRSILDLTDALETMRENSAPF